MRLAFPTAYNLVVPSIQVIQVCTRSRWDTRKVCAGLNATASACMRFLLYFLNSRALLPARVLASHSLLAVLERLGHSQAGIRRQA